MAPGSSDGDFAASRMRFPSGFIESENMLGFLEALENLIEATPAMGSLFLGSEWELAEMEKGHCPIFRWWPYRLLDGAPRALLKQETAADTLEVV